MTSEVTKLGTGLEKFGVWTDESAKKFIIILVFVCAGNAELSVKNSKQKQKWKNQVPRRKGQQARLLCMCNTKQHFLQKGCEIIAKKHSEKWLVMAV